MLRWRILEDNEVEDCTWSYAGWLVYLGLMVRSESVVIAGIEKGNRDDGRGSLESSVSSLYAHLVLWRDRHTSDE